MLFVVMGSSVTNLTSLCIISLIRLRVSAMEISKFDAMFSSFPIVERVEKFKSLDSLEGCEV